MLEYFNINLQYLFLHTLVYNRQFIIQYALYEHTSKSEKNSSDLFSPFYLTEQQHQHYKHKHKRVFQITNLTLWRRNFLLDFSTPCI